MIHRFLPHEISILFIHYLWLYYPFKVLLIQFHVDNAKFTPYFWPLIKYATTVPKKKKDLSEEAEAEAENLIRKRARAYTSHSMIDPDLLDLNTPRDSDFCRIRST